MTSFTNWDSISRQHRLWLRGFYSQQPNARGGLRDEDYRRMFNRDCTAAKEIGNQYHALQVQYDSDARYARERLNAFASSKKTFRDDPLWLEQAVDSIYRLAMRLSNIARR